MPKKPDIKSYLNIHHYLEDLYKYRKAHEADFSYETWSYELGLQNRSFLRQIVIGRRAMTENTAKIFAQRLNFQGSDREYFDLLVEYSKCRNQRQRNMYGQKLMSLLKADFQQAEIENYYELVARPLYPKILTLLTFQDIPKTTASLATLLGASKLEVQAGLEKLESLNLIEKDPESQQWKATQRQVKVPDAIGDGALMDYHAQSLQEAIEARRLPKDQRRYKALLLPMSSEEFARFMGELQVFATETMKRYDSDDLRSRRLHQINFNIYAVSDEPEACLPQEEGRLREEV